MIVFPNTRTTYCQGTVSHGYTQTQSQIPEPASKSPLRCPAGRGSLRRRGGSSAAPGIISDCHID